MQKLSGKTILITGGSRGIGYAIGMKCAKAGANIVIVSKEDLTHATNTSIYTVADEMRKTGVKALAIDTDVRDDNAIKKAVNEAVTQFGSIDALINNVSAFCFTDTLHTSADKFDLLMSVNARATFLMSKACIPFLKNAANPHIITISPPLEMHSRWFNNHLAFTLSKYGMSMCTLGMAEELREMGIGVNSLWPMTTIATTTIQDHFTAKVYAGSRWPTIMADAAFEVLQRNARDCTGNFFIDEIILREAGVTDFLNYAVDPNVPLVQDLFIPEKITSADDHSIPLSKNLFNPIEV